MSAFGGKADSLAVLSERPIIARSGHRNLIDRWSQSLLMRPPSRRPRQLHATAERSGEARQRLLGAFMNIEERGVSDGIEDVLNVIAEGAQGDLAVHLLDPLGERHQNAKTRAGHEINTGEVDQDCSTPSVNQPVELFLQYPAGVEGPSRCRPGRRTASDQR